MEAIWDDLTRDDRTFESSDWHEDILREREKALASVMPACLIGRRKNSYGSLRGC
jgi:hypothetical protein